MNSKVAAISFCDAEVINKWNCILCKDINFIESIAVYNNDTLTAGFVGYIAETKTIVASWKGSNNKLNWWEDVNMELVPYGNCKGCKIYAGFYFDYLMLADRVISEIDKIKRKYSVDKILTIGHSLGAVISLIMGLELALHYTQI